MSEIKNEVEVLAESAVNKALTLQEFVNQIVSDESQDRDLVNNIRRFKLMMIKKSLTDVVTMMQASDMVQSALVDKITTDIGVYPITVLLDIMNSINKIMDRNLSLIESVLPKSEDLLTLLTSTNKNITMINQVNLEDKSPASLEKISLIVESVINKINSIDD